MSIETIAEVWDTIKAHKLTSMVNDVYEDVTVIVVLVKTPRTATYLEQLFGNSAVEVMVTK